MLPLKPLGAGVGERATHDPERRQAGVNGDVPYGGLLGPCYSGAMPPANPLILYEEIYKCMDCASAVSDESVRSFVQTGPGQTIPVSHFGDIRSSKIWLVSTNPKGNRHDSNVSYLPPGFVSRAALRPDQVQQVFGHFSAYFQSARIRFLFRPLDPDPRRD